MEEHGKLFDKRFALAFDTHALFMTTFVPLTIKSCQHGALMRCADWRAGRQAGGDVEFIF